LVLFFSPYRIPDIPPDNRRATFLEATAEELLRASVIVSWWPSWFNLCLQQPYQVFRGFHFGVNMVKCRRYQLKSVRP